MEFNGPIAAAYKMAEWIYHLVYLNIIWLLFNLPILFLVANLLLAKEIEVILTLGILIGCLLPFLFFPSTFALFQVMKRLLDKEGVLLLREMIHNVRNDYKKLLSTWWICTSFWTVLSIDLVYMIQLGKELAVLLFICIAFFAGIFQLLLFESIDSATTRKKQFIYTATTKMVKKPIISILIGVLSFGLLYIFLSKSLYFFLLLSVSMISFMTIYLLKKS